MKSSRRQDLLSFNAPALMAVLAINTLMGMNLTQVSHQSQQWLISPRGPSWTLRVVEMGIIQKTIVIAGLNVNVYSSSTSTDTLTSSGTPGKVTIQFLLHDGLNSAKRIGWVAQSILEQVSLKRTKKIHPSSIPELLVITIDHRNHGTRVIDRKANYAWSKSHHNNDNHAVDMYAIQVGTARDISYLMDFLPSYLYPAGEKVISQWIMSGISLGGNSGWIALAHDPRVKIGVFLIGCPDYTTLIAHIAKRSDIKLIPPIMPDILHEAIKRNDPPFTPYQASDFTNPFYGKRILALFGGADQLLPWSISKNFFEKLNVGEHGFKEAIIYPGVGHECTREMVEKLVEFVWDEALCPAAKYKTYL